MQEVVFIRSTSLYNDSRATKEIYALVEAGYHVTALGWNRDGLAEEKCAQLFFSVKEQVECRLYNQKIGKGIGFKNVGKLLSWFRWVKRTLTKIENIKFVHACDLDSGLPAFKYCKRHKVKLIYDIYDYYVDTHMSIPKILKNRIEKREIKIINHARTTIICTEERREQISKAKPKNVLVIHNSPEVEMLPAIESEYDYAYCGSLNNRRLIEEIFSLYEQNKDLSFKFGGYGRFEDIAKSLSSTCERFSFVGAIPYSEVLKIEQSAKVLSAIYEPTTRNHRLCAPNKFYEALALGKPLIVCKGTGIDKIVEKYEIGCVIDYSAEQFYQSIRMLKDNPILCQEMGMRARQLYEEKYKWSLMKEKLIKCYHEI